MPMTIFDWIARTAMLVMAGLVTLSILGSIAAMTNDPGTGFAPGERPRAEAERAEEQEAAPPAPLEGRPTAAAPGEAQGATVVSARPEDGKEARWLEAIAYALLAIAGVGALGVLMLWSILRELRRNGPQSRRPRD